MSLNGFVFVDKKSGESSFDVVRAVRKSFGVKKVGHTGTLDPLATGLLIVAVGEATKLIEYMMGHEKSYEVLAHFGFRSDSYDADGVIEEVSERVVGREEVEQAVRENFLYEVVQVPPKFSALKVDGKRAYALARAGEDFEIKARKIFVHKFDVLSFKWPFVRFALKVSSGSYVRSLVHDLGELLGVGAYVQELRRTEIDSFSLADVSEELVSVEEVGRRMMLEFEVSAQEEADLKVGKVVDFARDVPELALVSSGGKLFGVIGRTANPQSGKLKKTLWI